MRVNGLYSVGTFLIPSALLIGATPILVHLLGVRQFGIWSIALAAFGVFGVCDLGIGLALARYTASHRTDSPHQLSAALTFATAAYLVLIVLLTTVGMFASGSMGAMFAGGGLRPTAATEITRLVILGLLPLLMKSGASGILTGLERFRPIMLVAIIQNVVTYAAAVVLALLGCSLVVIVASAVVALWITALIVTAIAVPAARRLGWRYVMDMAVARELLRFACGAAVVGLGSTVFGTADRLTVGLLLGPREAGYYSIISSVASKAQVAVDYALRPMMPIVSSQLSAAGARVSIVGAGEAGSLARRATAWTAAIVAVCMTVAWLAVPSILRLWMGSAFAAHSALALEVLLGVYGVVAIATPAYHFAIGLGKVGVCAAVALVGGFATIGLMVAFRNYGLTGMAIANAAYCVTLGIPIYLGRLLRASRVELSAYPSPGNA